MVIKELFVSTINPTGILDHYGEQMILTGLPGKTQDRTDRTMPSSNKVSDCSKLANWIPL